MGIRNQAEFENMEQDVDVATEEQVTDSGPTEAKTEHAPAKASNTQVATPAKKFHLAFAENKDVLDTPTVEALSMSSPRIKGEQGAFFQADEELGARIRIEVISWNNRWAIGTGENDAEAKDYFRVSYDNETLAGEGTPVSEYMEYLKAQGFNKAKVSPYIDIFCFVVWTEAKGDIDPEERELCILQCSQTSAGNFRSFCTTRGLMESKGLVQPLEEVEVEAVKRAKGTNKYTNFSFHAPKK